MKKTIYNIFDKTADLVLAENEANELLDSIGGNLRLLYLHDENSSLDKFTLYTGDKVIFFEENMTWEDWVSSKYNTIGAKILNRNIYFNLNIDGASWDTTFKDVNLTTILSTSKVAAAVCVIFNSTYDAGE